MRILGLVSLLIVVGIIGWWFMATSGQLQSVTTEEEDTEKVSYQDALDSAREVVDSVEEKVENLPPLPPIPPMPGNGVVVYDGIEISKSATTLDLSGRGLTGSLKAEVRHLSNLRELDISDNNFTGLPAEVGQLSKLEVLNLSNNPFTGLPYELGNLSNLKVLDLRGTNYAEQDLGVIRQTLPADAEVLTD